MFTPAANQFLRILGKHRARNEIGLLARRPAHWPPACKSAVRSDVRAHGALLVPGLDRRAPLRRRDSADVNVTRRRLGDRRGRPRFEIVGQLWGALETIEPLRLRNLSRGGALLESASPLTPDSVHRLRVAFADVVADLQARVCHVRVTSHGPGERYLIGLEFLHAQQSTLDRIEALVRESGPPDRPEVEA